MDNLLPLLGFTVAISATPGPNTVMVAAAAARHGVRATLPHMVGISVGMVVMTVAVGLGAGAVFAALPWLHTVLLWSGAAWLLWLAWKIGMAGAPEAGEGRPPLGLLGAAAFQWANPKAWLAVLGAIAAFAGPDTVEGALRIALIFGAISMPALLLWAGIGRGAAALLHGERAWRAFNVTMGVLLAASIVPALFV